MPPRKARTSSPRPTTKRRNEKPTPSPRAPRNPVPTPALPPEPPPAPPPEPALMPKPFATPAPPEPEPEPATPAPVSPPRIELARPHVRVILLDADRTTETVREISAADVQGARIYCDRAWWTHVDDAPDGTWRYARI